MNEMTFKDVMEGYQKTVEAYLQTLFAEDAPQKQLFDAMRGDPSMKWGNAGLGSINQLTG